MAIQTRKTYSGSNMISTLGGQIRLEEATGRLVVYDPISGDVRSVQDLTGFHVYNNNTEVTRMDNLGTHVYNDGSLVSRLDNLGLHVYNDGEERSRLDPQGLTTIRSDGTYANRVGQASDNNRDGIWAAKPGIDLRDKGI